MHMSICIGHNTDRIAEGEIWIYLITGVEKSPILNNVAIVDSLHDSFLIHTRCSFSGLSVPDLTVKFRH